MMGVLVTAIAFLSLLALLAASCRIDIRARTIPNRLVCGVVALWLAWRCALVALGEAQPLSLACDAAGALLVGGALLAFTAVAERASGRLMMGGGDIKLLAAVALFLGVQGAVIALLAACLVSFAFASARLARGIPFAPCILCGTLVALLAC